MQSDKKQILVIDPGSTSTKIALYVNEELQWQKTILYKIKDLKDYNSAYDQIDLRQKDIQLVLDEKQVDLKTLSAVVGRGGAFKPMSSGTYRVTEAVIQDVKDGHVMSEHISNIGVILANHFAEIAEVHAFFVDPVCVDEFEPLARYSGMPEIERRSLLHALNIRISAKKIATRLGKSINELNLIIAHLGGGISICAMKKGRMVDVNNANEEGPFSPERCGTLPSGSLIKLCFSGKFGYDALRKRIVGQGGLSAYLDTNQLPEIWKRIDEGENEACIVLEAMAYQIAKEIGAMSTVLSGMVHAIILTGGLSHDVRLMSWIEGRIAFIAPIYRLPGEFEMEALARGVLRVLKHEEEELVYPNA